MNEDWNVEEWESIKKDIKGLPGVWISKIISKDPEVDSELKFLLGVLNSKGYITSWSCAGHDWADGFIDFWETPLTGSRRVWSKLEKLEIRRVLKDFGVSKLDFTTDTDCGTKRVEFSSIAEDPGREWI